LFLDDYKKAYLAVYGENQSSFFEPNNPASLYIQIRFFVPTKALLLSAKNAFILDGFRAKLLV